MFGFGLPVVSSNQDGVGANLGVHYLSSFLMPAPPPFQRNVPPPVLHHQIWNPYSVYLPSFPNFPATLAGGDCVGVPFFPWLQAPPAGVSWDHPIFILHDSAPVLPSPPPLPPDLSPPPPPPETATVLGNQTAQMCRSIDSRQLERRVVPRRKANQPRQNLKTIVTSNLKTIITSEQQAILQKRAIRFSTDQPAKTSLLPTKAKVPLPEKIHISLPCDGKADPEVLQSVLDCIRSGAQSNPPDATLDDDIIIVPVPPKTPPPVVDLDAPDSPQSPAECLPRERIEPSPTCGPDSPQSPVECLLSERIETSHARGVSVSPEKRAKVEQTTTKSKKRKVAPPPDTPVVAGRIPSAPGDLEILGRHKKAVICMAVLDSLLVTSAADCTMNIYDFSTGVLLAHRTHPGKQPATGIVCVLPTDRASRDVRRASGTVHGYLDQFSIVTGASTGMVRCLEFANSKIRKKVRLRYPVSCMVKNDLNSSILIGLERGSVYLLRPRDGKCEKAKFQATTQVTCMVVSRWDGDPVVLVASHNHPPVIRQLKTGKLLLTLVTSDFNRSLDTSIRCCSMLDGRVYCCHLTGTLAVFNISDATTGRRSAVKPVDVSKVPSSIVYCTTDSSSKMVYLAGRDGRLWSYDAEAKCFTECTMLAPMAVDELMSCMLVHEDKVVMANEKGQVAWQLVRRCVVS